MNARIQNTDNFASSGYRSLSQTLASGCKDKLDMDRLKNNYHYKVLFTTWNRRSARNGRPQYWDAPHYRAYQNTNKTKILLSGNFGFNYRNYDGVSANVEVNRRAYNRTSWSRGLLV